MIRVKDATLTANNLAIWYNEWLKDYQRIKDNEDIFTNKLKLKMPFAKKLVITSSAAAIGDGITLSVPENLSPRQQITFDRMIELYKKQTIDAEDAEIIKNGCEYSKAYELLYMSSDDMPVPKTASISPLNGFVVFDDTVENNSLYGIYFNEYMKGKDWFMTFYIYDSVNVYEREYLAKDIKEIKLDDYPITAETGKPHNMGRVPLTEYLNNKEEQSDFEQVIELIRDRSSIHNLNIKDMKEIAKNYLKGRNIKFAGITEQEKQTSKIKAAELQLIEVEADTDAPNDDITILSKTENYSSVDVFGGDIDSKIYDLSLIPDLTSDTFAGNITGVALEFKLLPFKEMIKTKDPAIERLYRRRNKMYIDALSLNNTEYEWFDAGDIIITTNRNWTKNIVELGSLIQTLKNTGLFSDKRLTNIMPDVDYDEEQTQLTIERKEKAKLQTTQLDPNNSSVEQIAALMREQQQGGANAAAGGEGNANTV